MGASVRPDPVAEYLRAKSDPVADYLAAKGADTSSALPSAPKHESMLTGIGRAALQGGLFNFGDELGLVDKTKAAAFREAHPIADLLATIGGGAIAPMAAVAAAPAALAGLGGAAAVGGAAGLLSGVGAGETTDGRIKGGLLGGGFGAGLGAAGYGLGQVGGKVANTVLDRMNPERVVARAAQQVVTPATAQRMVDVNALAPGGSSVASATVPSGGATNSRLLSMARGLGKNPDAAAAAESALMGQRAALKAGGQAIGDKMDALGGEIKVTPQIRDVMTKVRGVLGGKAPDVPVDVAMDVNPLGLEKSTPFSFDPEVKTLSIDDMRSALSRIRYAVRQAEKRGTEANGATLYELKEAQSALTEAVYKARPDFATLDQQYGMLKNELRQVDKLTKTVQLSRQNHAGNEAYGATAGSLGGSLPKGAQSVVMSALDGLLTNKAGAADAVARLVMKPGGPEMVDRLLSRIPTAGPTLPLPLRRGLGASLPPSIAGLLSPQNPP